MFHLFQNGKSDCDTSFGFNSGVFILFYVQPYIVDSEGADQLTFERLSVRIKLEGIYTAFF